MIRTAHDLLLALDTATRRTTVAVADGGTVRRSVQAAREDGALLDHVDLVLREEQVTVADLRGIVVGIGPGSFTGLRIGLATAKTLAYACSIRLAGVPTVEALALALAAGEAETITIVLPAGARDHYLSRVRVEPAAGTARLSEPIRLVPPGGAAAAIGAGDRVVAVDVDDGLGTEAAALGERAQGGLAAALLRLGAARLASGMDDDPATLVPQYIALPRGLTDVKEMAWSPDLR